MQNPLLWVRGSCVSLLVLILLFENWVKQGFEHQHLQKRGQKKIMLYCEMQNCWSFISCGFESLISPLPHLLSLPPVTPHTAYGLCLSCASVSPELLLAQETGSSWPTSNQQKLCCRASCCSFSCHRGTPFNPLPVSSCQCLQNLQEFNYLQGFYLSIKLDWNKSMNLQMVKGEKVWQTGPTYKLHCFRRVSEKLNSGKDEILKSIHAWTVRKIVWLWSKRE